MLQPRGISAEDRVSNNGHGDWKEYIAQLREQLELLQERIDVRDAEFARQAEDLSDLRRSLAALQAERDLVHAKVTNIQQEATQQADHLQSEIYDLADQCAIDNLTGTDAGRQIRYRQAMRRLREAVKTHLPPQAKVLVVSRGDDELLKLYGRVGSHFPQTRDGIYSGYYPGSGFAAIAHLETLRAQGAEYLVFPESALWWLDLPKYADFQRFLEGRFRKVFNEPATGVIFSLRESSCYSALEQAVAECELRLRRPLTILNWSQQLELADRFPQAQVFRPTNPNALTLPYMDRSIDAVVVDAADDSQLGEARRVASQLVIVSNTAATNSAGELSPNFQIEWQTTATSTLPTVTIIIPVHNHAATTRACLASLADTLPASFRGEVIVVDDASTDDTPAVLSEWSRENVSLRLLRNDINQGFLASVRLAAANATGDILVFLNNDTILLPNWLPPLLQVFRDFPSAGAVGGKLLFADGVLQEAGGMVFQDSSAANFGRGDHDITAAVYNTLREVDYCSGALLATPRALYEQLGGFDQRYTPAYYEDTDYCFAIRQLGYRVFYQPESAVVHLEGVSSGTDLTRGVKQYQVVNQRKFAEKWAEVLRLQPPRPKDESNREVWQALAYGHRLPTEDLS